MTHRTLVIGDKNISSWSLRPWLIMKQAGIPFAEEIIPLDMPETKAAILAKSPSGFVPCLIDGEFAIWDSLAIAEYLAETFPEKRLWPEDKRARAHARSISAEMHSGFADLRREWSMRFSEIGKRQAPSPAVQKCIDRIGAIWAQARKEFGAAGPFLYGRFSIADAMYAPVVSRFMTYGPVELPAEAAAWRDMMFGLPAMKEWGEGAAKEAYKEH